TANGGPTAGAFLAGGVEDDIDKRLASVWISGAQYFCGDFNEVGIQVAGIPLLEDCGNFCWLHARAVAQQLVSLADNLHVSVLNAIVNHLDKVPRAIRSNVGHTWNPVDDSRDGFEDRAQGLPGLCRTTWHDRWAIQRAFFATGNASADEVTIALCHLLFAADGVRVQRIAAVDDDVAIIHRVCQLLDNSIGRSARLNHDDGLAGAL